MHLFDWYIFSVVVHNAHFEIIVGSEVLFHYFYLVVYFIFSFFIHRKTDDHYLTIHAFNFDKFPAGACERHAFWARHHKKGHFRILMQKYGTSGQTWQSKTNQLPKGYPTRSMNRMLGVIVNIKLGCICISSIICNVCMWQISEVHSTYTEVFKQVFFFPFFYAYQTCPTWNRLKQWYALKQECSFWQKANHFRVD